MATKSDYRLS